MWKPIETKSHVIPINAGVKRSKFLNSNKKNQNLNLQNHIWIQHENTLQQIWVQWFLKCDVIKQNELELGNIVFKIQPNKAIVSFFLFFLIVFEILQLCVSLEQIVLSLWGFHQIKTYTIPW